MFVSSSQGRVKNVRKIVSLFIIVSFAFSSITPVSYGQIAPLSGIGLPPVGQMVTQSVGFAPATLKGIKIDPANPLHFNFYVDSGENHLKGEDLKQESEKLVKYFLASLTVPENELWVNLSPYEKDRIIPQAFGQTDMGKDLLSQDYILKQLTASLMYPEKELGQTFWSKVYAQAQKKFGTTDINTDTFHKVWIVPEKAVVYVKDNSAFVVDSYLKVMLEQDYAAMKNANIKTDDTSIQNESLIREIIIPAIEKEVNTGANFANLRQIYHAMILSTWFKKNLRDSLLGQVYMNRNKVKGIDLEDKEVGQKIYNQYLEAFNTGVYNYIKEEYDPQTQSVVPRKYFSGGFDKALLVQKMQEVTHINKPIDAAGNMNDISVNLADFGPKAELDSAIIADEEKDEGDEPGLSYVKPDYDLEEKQEDAGDPALLSYFSKEARELRAEIKDAKTEALAEAKDELRKLKADAKTEEEKEYLQGVEYYSGNFKITFNSNTKKKYGSTVRKLIFRQGIWKNIQFSIKDGGFYLSESYKKQLKELLNLVVKEQLILDKYRMGVELSLADNAMTAEDNSTVIRIGNDYWNGKIKTSPIERPVRPSKKEDVLDITEVKGQKAHDLEVYGAREVLKGKGVIAMLIAGGSSRMAPKRGPREVQEMSPYGKIESKAGVPIGKIKGKVITYLDAFGINVSRFFKSLSREAAKANITDHVQDNEILFLSNNDYRPEHDRILEDNNYYGLNSEKIRFYHQPLEPKFVATPEDVDALNAKGKFDSEKAYQQARALSEKVQKDRKEDPASVILEGEEDPLGHGEFFHQLVVSNELLHMIETGREWIAVKNVDNYAAKFDRVFLRILGAFLSQDAEAQLEVSPRAPGQAGGTHVIATDTNSHMIAEDPSIHATNKAREEKDLPPLMSTADSYWFNDAVAIFKLKYIISLYKNEGQSDKEFIAELKSADRKKRLLIADRGRQKFPKLLDVKPARETNAAIVKVETNMWQSTNVIPQDIQVDAVGVRGAGNFTINKYLVSMSEKEKIEALQNLRFLATKHWNRTEEDKNAVREKIEKALGRKVTEEELAIRLESYEGNKVLAQDLLEYITEGKLIPEGILDQAMTVEEIDTKGKSVQKIVEEIEEIVGSSRSKEAYIFISEPGSNPALEIPLKTLDNIESRKWTKLIFKFENEREVTLNKSFNGAIEVKETTFVNVVPAEIVIRLEKQIGKDNIAFVQYAIDGYSFSAEFNGKKTDRLKSADISLKRPNIQITLKDKNGVVTARLKQSKQDAKRFDVEVAGDETYKVFKAAEAAEKAKEEKESDKALTAEVPVVEQRINSLLKYHSVQDAEKIVNAIKEAGYKDGLDQLSFMVDQEGTIIALGPRKEFENQYLFVINKKGNSFDAVKSSVSPEDMTGRRGLLRDLIDNVKEDPSQEIIPGVKYQKQAVALTDRMKREMFAAQAEREFLSDYEQRAEEAKTKFSELYQMVQDIKAGKATKLVLTKELIQKWGIKENLVKTLLSLAAKATAGMRATQNMLNPADLTYPMNVLLTLFTANELGEMSLRQAKKDKNTNPQAVVAGEVRYNTPLVNAMTRQRLAAMGFTVHSPKAGDYLPIGASSFITTLEDVIMALYDTSSHAARMIYASKVMGFSSQELSDFEKAVLEAEGEDIAKFQKATSEGSQLLIDEMVSIANGIAAKVDHVLETGEPLVLDFVSADHENIRLDLDNPEHSENIDVSKMYSDYLSESYLDGKTRKSISSALESGLLYGYDQGSGSSYGFNKRVLQHLLGDSFKKIDWASVHPDSFFNGTGIGLFNAKGNKYKSIRTFVESNMASIDKFFSGEKAGFSEKTTLSDKETLEGVKKEIRELNKHKSLNADQRKKEAELLKKAQTLMFEVFPAEAEKNILRARGIPYVKLSNGNLLAFYEPSLFDSSQDVSILEVVMNSGLPAYLKDKPIGFIDATTDPDGDRYVVMQVEKNDAETKSRLDRLNVAYLKLSDEKLLVVYTPNQNFFDIQGSLIETLKERGEFRQHLDDFDEYNDVTFFGISTTVSTSLWRDLWKTNKVPTVLVPVGFKEIARMERLVEDQVKINEMRVRLGLRKQKVIVHDVFGRPIDLGYNPRLLFAGEESGGMVVGKAALMKSKDGTRQFLAWREKNAVEANALMLRMASQMFNKAKTKLKLNVSGDEIYQNEEFLKEMSLSRQLEKKIQAQGSQNTAELRTDFTLLDLMRLNKMSQEEAKAYNQGAIDQRDANDSFFVGLAFALQDGDITLDDVKAILKDAFATSKKIREELSSQLDQPEDKVISDLNQWIEDELTGFYFQGDGVYMDFKNGGYAIVRPSGTDPKIKGYPSTHDADLSKILSNAIVLLNPLAKTPELWKKVLTEKGRTDMLDSKTVMDRKQSQYQRGLAVDTRVEWDSVIKDALKDQFGPAAEGLDVSDVFVRLGPRTQKSNLMYVPRQKVIYVSWDFADHMDKQFESNHYSEIQNGFKNGLKNMETNNQYAMAEETADNALLSDKEISDIVRDVLNVESLGDEAREAGIVYLVRLNIQNMFRNDFVEEFYNHYLGLLKIIGALKKNDEKDKTLFDNIIIRILGKNLKSVFSKTVTGENAEALLKTAETLALRDFKNEARNQNVVLTDFNGKPVHVMDVYSIEYLKRMFEAQDNRLKNVIIAGDWNGAKNVTVDLLEKDNWETLSAMFTDKSTVLHMYAQTDNIGNDNIPQLYSYFDRLVFFPDRSAVDNALVSDEDVQKAVFTVFQKHKLITDDSVTKVIVDYKNHSVEETKEINFKNTVAALNKVTRNSVLSAETLLKEIMQEAYKKTQADKAMTTDAKILEINRKIVTNKEDLIRQIKAMNPEDTFVSNRTLWLDDAGLWHVVLAEDGILDFKDNAERTVFKAQVDPEIYKGENWSRRAWDAIRMDLLEALAEADDALIVDNVGGIDLNPEFLDMQIKRDDNGVPLPLNMQPLKTMHIEGFIPVIINITPVENFPMLLGVTETGDEESLPQAAGLWGIEPKDRLNA